MFERFTTPARDVVVQAQDSARRVGDDQIGVEHLLLGLLASDEGDGRARSILAEFGVTTEAVERELAARHVPGRLGAAEADALESIGIDLEAIRRRVEEAFGEGALDRGVRRPRRGHIPFTRQAKKVLELSLREARALRHDYIGTEHVLLGLTRLDDEPTAGVLRALEASPKAIHARVLAELRKAS
jgi:ATP-dependent Clp protease ATP-binding subunit ClpA